jgi:hypothetical protein
MLTLFCYGIFWNRKQTKVHTENSGLPSARYGSKVSLLFKDFAFLFWSTSYDYQLWTNLGQWWVF